MSASGATVPLRERVAGAPISWGVCEVPGWGFQLDPPTVLGQMSRIGLQASEFGPDGFLPEQPREKAATLAAYGLRAVGQFVPVVLHRADHDPLPQVHATIEALVAAEASTLVLAAVAGSAGYESRPVLSDAQWSTLLGNLDRLAQAAAERGLVATLHPHVGTLVESGQDTDRVLRGSHIGLCLDTGHLLIGGGDPVEVARRYPKRIAHVHLKDVRAEVVAKVRGGDLGYAEAVRQGLYCPLGQGDVDIRAIIEALEGAGYRGWYVLEQDTVLGEPVGAGPENPADNPAGNPAMANARASLAYLLAAAGGAG